MESVAQILSSRYFCIPVNQRGFSWKKEHMSELVSDLKLAGKKAHYMGPIIVTRDQSGDFEEDNYNPVVKCILEDGQQRLTTFFILIRYLQLRFEEIDKRKNVEYFELNKILFYSLGNSYYLRFKNLNSDLDACFSYCICNTPPLPGDRTAPMRSMLEAKEWAFKFFDGMSRSDCEMWKNRLVNQARFILVDLDSAGVDRYLTFDAINSRGLPLSEFDKIKNFCILLNDRRSLNSDPEGNWYKSLQNLDKYSVGQRSSEESFITELFNVFHDKKVTQGNVHEEFVNIYRPLLENKNTALEGDLIAFIRIWPEYAESYGLMTTKNKKIHYGKECTAEAGTWLDRLESWFRYSDRLTAEIRWKAMSVMPPV